MPGADAAQLDLRLYPIMRGEMQPTERPRLQLPRGWVRWTLLLPAGSEPGPYDVEIRDAGAVARAAARGDAALRSQVTTLDITVATGSLSTGAYQLAVRRAGDGWQERARRDTQTWLLYLWGADALMAVRRELDDQAGVINLKNLLYEIEARPDVMTRRRFMEWACPSCCWCHHQAEKARAADHFESFDLIRFPKEHQWDEFERDYVDPASVARDRRQMEERAEEAFRYAQLLIAHRTPKDHLEIRSGAIDRALDTIWEMVRKYYLLPASEPLTKHPRPPRHWRKPFEYPWCEPAKADADGPNAKAGPEPKRSAE